MSNADLEKLLRDLPRVGTLVKDRGYRQVWRFEFQGRGYYLKFYPRTGFSLKRQFRGNPAHREFVRLQALQRASVPAPRAVAHLVGFRLNNLIGDAVILEAIEPSQPLDQYVLQQSLAGEFLPDHRELAQGVLNLVQQLGRAKLGHNDLHLGNILRRGEQLYLLDAYAVRFGGMKMNDVLQLAHSTQGIATRTDALRVWKALMPGAIMPDRNRVSARQWRKFMERTSRENATFGRLHHNAAHGEMRGDWKGIYFKSYKYPRRWAPASRLNVSASDWQREFPRLLERIESGQLDVLKQSPSGDVLAGQIVLAGKPIEIVVKRPYKRYWYRYVNEIGRGSRSWRAWRKAWNLVIRDIPTAWPLLVMQKRRLGYITDSLIVFERVAGPTLAHADLDAMTPTERARLFHRTGAILRRIDQFGFAHFDAKSTNWIVQEDDKLGKRPILIDVDGVRFRRWTALGIGRLLRAMLLHPQYTPEDSLALCQGYSPNASMIQQMPMEDSPGEDDSSGEEDSVDSHE